MKLPRALMKKLPAEPHVEKARGNFNALA